jgi:YggT family protein
VSNFWSAVYLVLFLFYLGLLARMTVSLIRMFARSWHPARGLAVMFEGIYTVTDPPLRALRRAIPPVRAGGIALDLGFLILIIIVWLLLNVVGYLR